MIRNKLFDWQKTIVNTAKEKYRYGLFLDCGLGKTPVSLALAEANKCSKVLIITINAKASENETVNGSWLDWASGLDGGDYQLIDKKKFKDPKVKFGSKCVALINYESLYSRSADKKVKVQLIDRLTEFIKSCKGQDVCLILDESHKIKDSSSLQCQAINKLDRELRIYGNSLHAYLLTGTPFTQGFIDLYTQLKFLGCPMTKTEFVDRFCIRACIPGLLEWQQPIKSYKNINQLYDLVHQYALTIKSKEVIELPEQIFVNHLSKQSDSFTFLTQDKLPGVKVAAKLSSVGIVDDRYTSIKDKKTKVPNLFYRNIAYPSPEWAAETAGSFWMRSRQLSIGFQGNSESYLWYDKDRLEQLKTFLTEYPDNYILFYNYTPELIEIYDICSELGYKIDVFSGEMKSEFYYEQYLALTDGDRLTDTKRILLANFASGSTGKNWQAYSKCILFSTPLYKDYEQALKRINRIGQKQTTVYHCFYSSNWLDASMWKALQENCQYSEDMFKQDLIKFNKGEA